MRQGFNRWLDRRIPASNNITFHHRQTFVLPTRFGYMILLILILMLIAATNYQNSMAFLLTFTLASLGFNVIVQTYRNLTGINVTTTKVDAIHAGQYLDIPLILTSTENRDYHAIGYGTRTEVQQVVNIKSDAVTETFIRVLPEDRGWYSPGRLYTVTSYPLGLLRVWSWFQFKQQYLVYPTAVDPRNFEQSTDGAVEKEQGRMEPGNEEFFGIRGYRAGDAKRKIHWRAYARGQGLQTMEFVEPEGRSSVLDFDRFQGIETELRLSWLCFLIIQAETSGEKYGLKVPGTTIAPNHGDKHKQNCLKTLALYNGVRHQESTTGVRHQESSAIDGGSLDGGSL